MTAVVRITVEDLATGEKETQEVEERGWHTKFRAPK